MNSNRYDRNVPRRGRRNLGFQALTADIRQDGLPYPRRWWAIVTVGFAVFMTVAYTSMTNVALPSIARDLNVPPSSTIWIVNAYQVAIMLSLLPLASVPPRSSARWRTPLPCSSCSACCRASVPPAS